MSGWRGEVQEDRVLGCAGRHRRVDPGALDIGYWLRTSETGRGTMTEAVRALANEALSLAGVDRVEIHCDAANDRARPSPAIWVPLDEERGRRKLLLK